jgi:hypothetical protein
MAKDYLNAYSTPKFQMGGEMPAEAPMEGPAPEAAPQGGANELEMMLAQYAETRDPQIAVAICDVLVEQLMGGGAQPMPAAGMGTRMEAPMFRKGGRLK